MLIGLIGFTVFLHLVHSLTVFEQFPSVCEMSASPIIHDVLIIGSGPGGLSTATALSRQLRTATLFDSGLYRNARATHMHNYLGFDHVPPPQFRAKARQDLKARYNTTTFIDREILTISKLPTTSHSDPTRATFIFKAVDSASESHYGRAVVLATGVTDIMPDSLPGFADCWGHGVFHCLFCHGFEERGTPSAGVLMGGLATNPMMALHFAHMAKQLAKSVTIYSNGDDALGDQLETLIAGNNHFKLDRRRITKMEMANTARGDGSGDHDRSDITLTFDKGEPVTEGFISHAPKYKVNGPFVEQLGLELADNGADIKTINMFYETTVPGVYAVGDCSVNPKAVVTAAGSGALAAGGMTMHFATQPADLVIPN